MNIFVIGINYKLANVEIREKLKFSEDEYASVLKKLNNLSQVSECSIISTCNRTEVYLYSETCELDSDCIEKLLCQIKGLDIYSMKKYFYFYKGTKALRHIFSVACGMDSMARFEDQILGQFKSAHEISLKAGTTSTVLNTLFRQAVTTAKRIKTLMGNLRDCASIADVAIKTTEKIFKPSHKDRCAMVIGTGRIGAAVVDKLIEVGIGKIYVTKRTHSKTVCFPKFEKNIAVIDYSSRYSFVDECDIIISSTSSPHYTITRDMLEKSIKNPDKVRLFIDLAVPRDFDAAIQQLVFARYYNIDDMKTDGYKCVGEDDVVSFVEEMLSEGVLEFKKWYEFRCVLPVVKDMQRFADGIVQEKTEYALAKLKLLTEGEKEVVKASISSAVNSIMDRLVYGAREFDNSQEREIYLRYLRDIIVNNQ